MKTNVIQQKLLEDNNRTHFDFETNFTSSRPELFREKKAFLKISQNSQEKNWLQACIFKKRDSNTGVLLRILRNF